MVKPIYRFKYYFYHSPLQDRNLKVIISLSIPIIKIIQMRRLVGLDILFRDEFIITQCPLGQDVLTLLLQPYKPIYFFFLPDSLYNIDNYVHNYYCNTYATDPTLHNTNRRLLFNPRVKNNFLNNTNNNNKVDFRS